MPKSLLSFFENWGLSTLLMRKTVLKVSCHVVFIDMLALDACKREKFHLCFMGFAHFYVTDLRSSNAEYG